MLLDMLLHMILHVIRLVITRVITCYYTCYYMLLDMLLHICSCSCLYCFSIYWSRNGQRILTNTLRPFSAKKFLFIVICFHACAEYAGFRGTTATTRRAINPSDKNFHKMQYHFRAFQPNYCTCISHDITNVIKHVITCSYICYYACYYT